MTWPKINWKKKKKCKVQGLIKRMCVSMCEISSFIGKEKNCVKFWVQLEVCVCVCVFEVWVQLEEKECVRF